MKKFLNIMWPILSIIMVGCICFSGAMIFRNLYFSQIFVDGNSMNPTLDGESNNCHYGYMDTSVSTKKKIKRFDIVITYYPWEDYNQPYVPGGENKLKSTATYKIKRVYAMPNEIFSVGAYEPDKKNELTIYSSPEDQVGTKQVRDYEVRGTNRIKGRTTLSETQYYVMGDNWAGGSVDSYSKGPIYYENIVGVLIATEGHGKFKQESGKNVLYDMKPETPVYYKR